VTKSGSGPLAGLRVIDCSTGTAGTRAGGLLCDYGADVVWVEPPGGDPHRQRLAGEYSVYNRGKRGIELDLTSDSGRAELFRLLRTADVFIQSWRPGVAERLGVDFDTVHAQVPGLVYCSISGFGAEGRRRDVPGYEALAHALAGDMADQQGHREAPIFVGLPHSGFGAAFMAVIGTLAALHRALEDGWGRHVETSLFDGSLAHATYWGTNDARGETTLRADLGIRRSVSRTFLCSDDEYVAVHTGAVGAFGRLMELLGLADRFDLSADGLDLVALATPDERRVLDEDVPRLFGRRTRDEWVQLLQDADVAVAAVQRIGDAYDSPQIRHNGLIVEVDDPVLGPVEQIGPTLTFSATPAVVDRPAPTVGQHTDEVLGEADAASGWLPGPRGERDERPVLAGLKVLDLSSFMAGPYASRLLADLGADVVKVEPLVGDPFRGRGTFFLAVQAGKRSLALNLKDVDGAAVGRELLAWADVIHHNMRRSAAEALGVGYEDARRSNDDVVYVEAPGWGVSGPMAGRQAFAPLMSSYVGATYESGGRYNPPLSPLGHEDNTAGLSGAMAMLMALVHRRRTASGQRVESPLLNAAIASMVHLVRRPDGTVLGAERLDPMQYGFGALERLYETADGWICIVVRDDVQFAALDGCLEGALLADARFATQGGRVAHDDELADVIARHLERATSAQWQAAFDAAGVPAAVPVPPNNVAFFYDDESVATGRAAVLAHPTLVKVRELDQTVRISGAARAPHRWAPELGEHSTEVLAMLGHSPAEIDLLRGRGIIR
jgi:crotonobetainyl-CoA:carnitine CoA-transferase CaiB-like acyl-CoA transferase